MKSNTIFVIAGMSFLIAMSTNCADRPVEIVDREIESQPLILPSTLSANEQRAVESQPLLESASQKRIAVDQGIMVVLGAKAYPSNNAGKLVEDLTTEQPVDLGDNGSLKDGAGRFEQIGAKLKVSMRKKNARLAWCELCCAAPLACVCTPVVLTCRFATDMFAWATCGLCLITCCPKNSDATNGVVLDYEA